MSQSLLEVRKQGKAKKPVFTRQDSHRKKKIAQNWRRPRGIHSKMRLHVRGKKRLPQPGWGSPRAVEGLHPSGLRPVIVSMKAQIDALTKEDGIVFSATLGQRKKAELAAYALQKGITILNIRDVDSYLKSVSGQMASRKEKKKGRKSRSAAKQAEQKKDAAKGKEAAPKADAKPQPESQLSEEEQKKKEKEEKDRLLTKKV